MKGNSLSKRYAKAVIATIKDEKEYKNFKTDLKNFNDLLKMNDEFRAGMETSLFSKQQKTDLFNSIKKKAGFGTKTVNFIDELIEAGRLSIVGSIIETVEELWFEKSGIEKYTLYSAIPLDKKLEKELLESIEKTLNKKIVLEKEIDKSLIAGIKLKKGSIYYDFSIDGNLKKLYETLTEGSGEDSVIQEN